MKNTSILLLCFSVSIFLCSLLYLSYHFSTPAKANLAIPAGNTYLGPSGVLPDWVEK